MTPKRAVTAAVLVAPLGYLLIFCLVPLAGIVDHGLRPDGQWELGVVADVLGDDGLRRVAWYTMWQAALSTALTVVLALPAAYVFGRLDFPGKALFRSLVVVPFVMPTVVVGTAMLAIVGPGGPLSDLGIDLHQTTAAIVVAHAFFNYAVVTRTVGVAWARLGRDTEEAARMLGASPLRTVLQVALPQLRRSIGGAAAIVFLFCFTSFGVVKVIGGARLATLEVEIHRQATQLLDLPTAAVLAVVQLAAVVAALVLHGRLTRLDGGVDVDLAPPRRPASRGERAVLVATISSAGVLLGTPLAVLVVRSLSVGGGWGFDHYADLSVGLEGSTAFVTPAEAIANSLRFATVATLIAVGVGTLAAFGVFRLGPRARSITDHSLMLPLGVSAVTVGFGYLITLDQPPLDLRTSLWIVPLAQAVIAIPFVVRTVGPALADIDPTLREAAALLGAPPRRVLWSIDLGIAGRAVAAAAGFAFAISLGEFGATIFLTRADTATVPVAIFRSLSRPGASSFGTAMALSVILAAITASVFMVFDRVAPGRLGRF